MSDIIISFLQILSGSFHSFCYTNKSFYLPLTMFIISVKPLEIFVIALLESFSDNSIISVIPRFFLFYFILFYF